MLSQKVNLFLFLKYVLIQLNISRFGLEISDFR